MPHFRHLLNKTQIANCQRVRPEFFREKFHRRVFMSLRSSTQYEFARNPSTGFFLIRHTGGARTQERDGMDTGFRRYDVTFVPSRRTDHTCTGIFEGRADLTNTVVCRLIAVKTAIVRRVENQRTVSMVAEKRNFARTTGQQIRAELTEFFTTAYNQTGGYRYDPIRGRDVQHSLASDVLNRRCPRRGAEPGTAANHPDCLCLSGNHDGANLDRQRDRRLSAGGPGRTDHLHRR